jgi:hypothetical protein
MGIVIYQLVNNNTADFELEAIPLDFVRLNQSHTGEYLAKIVGLVVDKFGIQDKVSPIRLLWLDMIFHSDHF